MRSQRNRGKDDDMIAMRNEKRVTQAFMDQGRSDRVARNGRTHDSASPVPMSDAPATRVANASRAHQQRGVLNKKFEGEECPKNPWQGEIY